VRSVEVSWAEDYSRFTALFERFAVEVLLGCQSATKAAALLRLSWDEVHEIKERAVNRGLLRREEEGLVHIGIDEKSFMRGHSYITVVSDIDRSRVIEVGHGRDEAAVTDILDAMTDVQKEGIRRLLWTCGGRISMPLPRHFPMRISSMTSFMSSSTWERPWIRSGR
jgi:transposase